MAHPQGGLPLPNLLASTAITTAGTVVGTQVQIAPDAAFVAFEVVFTYGSGGTAAKLYLQTSLDNGTTWIDIACASFLLASATKLFVVSGVGGLAVATVPTDGALAADTTVDGVLGSLIRTKLVTTGTYATTTIAASAIVKAGSGGQGVSTGAAVPGVEAGMSSQPDNAQVSVPNTTSTALVAAASGVTKRRTLIRILTTNWYVREGAASSASYFLVQAGEAFVSSSLLAINGYQASGATVTAYVISEAR